MTQARRDMHDDGQAENMQEIDSLIGVAKDETERMLKTHSSRRNGVKDAMAARDGHRS